MQSYTHGEFQITGYKITTSRKDGKEKIDIVKAWQNFMSQNIADTIQGKLFDGIHAVYFNYTNQNDLQNRGYDMLLGFITDSKAKQINPELITITIPTQNYLYTEIESKTIEDLPTQLAQKWLEVNTIPTQEVARTFGFDMDMYSEDMSKVTLTVAVK